MPDAALAAQLHSRLAGLQSDAVTRLLNRDCNELAPGDTLLRLDRVEVDLGTIPLAALEPAVLERLQGRLKPALAAAIEARRAQAGGARQARQDSQLELLTAFARSGSLPWWADARAPQPVANALRFLATDAPTALRDLVSELADTPGALERLLGAIDESLLLLLLGGLAPRSTSVAPDLVRSLPQLQTNDIVASPTSRQRRMAWRRLLVAAAQGGAQWTSPADFPRHVVLLMAAEEGASYRNLARAWRQLAPTPGESVEPGFSSTPTSAGALDELAALLAEFDREAGSTSASTPDRSHRQLLQALVSGRVPADLVLAWLANAAPDPASGWTEAVLRELRDAVQACHRPSATAHPTPAPRPSINLAFSDTEEIYIDNAGLVLLWPFLDGFFRRLGLLAERQFRPGPWHPAAEAAPDAGSTEVAREADATTAAQRAAGLLQFIASGDAQPAEHLLPLNKVLCGLAVEDDFTFGPPVTAAERQEVDALLTAVIRQAPILHDMSIAGFRGSFLLRAGQLSARDHAWLLRVERASYDVVLERFPWPTQWVRLPWMNDPMQVDWV